MKINLAKSAGFCFGVKRAIDISFQTIGSRKNVYMLGDIVHNEEVARQMQESGLKKIKRLTRGENKTLLIRAHGVSLGLLNKARTLGYRIVDTTCPMVKEIHKTASDMQNSGYKIIVIGDKKHDEVRGIVGQLKKKAIVIDSPRGLLLEKIKKIKKAAIVVQSTQNIEKVMKIVALLKPRIRELKFFNTICKPTSIKQQEIKNMPRENDVMVIIGSKTSANTKRLFEISKTLNKRSFWVQKSKDLRPDWFKSAQSVGISAGASTPDRAIREIVECIKGLA
ncbi:MAG: 4-hydroxy-3-methylbut-2-enyl diphosphate reductase [Candidatus Omnitrophota bacterium]